MHLAAALHPTPAICGTPTSSARRLATELEGFDRGYYAGAVGWVDAKGDGEWAVSIRCAEVAKQSLRLYAGGGICRNPTRKRNWKKPRPNSRRCCVRWAYPRNEIDRRRRCG